MRANRSSPFPADSIQQRSIEWSFPLPRPQTGVLLGNGTQGVMVWGDRSLCLTISRAGFWDHRGGSNFSPNGSFQDLRTLVEQGDEVGITALLGVRSNPEGLRPEQYGGGRIDMEFPNGLRPVSARLHLADGALILSLIGDGGRAEFVTVRMARADEVGWLEADPSLLAATRIRCLPAWHFIEKTMRAKGIAAPEQWHEDECGGFLQTMPEDDALAVAWIRHAGQLIWATALGTAAESGTTARQRAADADPATLAAATAAWWKSYWNDVPDVRLPDEALQFLYDYGIYRQAGLTPPEGLPATLQGPWMEETRVPPWSNDFHFNINLQMIYSPALPTNRPGHYQPLWKMMRGWLPLLRQAGEAFFRRPGALMLPHAVDDRCKNIGGFWAGTIDHACIAWMARHAWDYYRHTQDEEHLRELAWPLLTGACEGYLAMLDEVDDHEGGKRWSLPVSVSPEYGGSNIQRCWGRDASFQLAALHMVLSILPEAATALGREIDPRWQEIREHLPQYTLAVSPEDESRAARSVIGLWQNLALPTSHRHHSHLAGIHPFHTLDNSDPIYAPIVAASMRQWVELGAGRWTGWSVVWASELCARMDWVDAAALWLNVYRTAFNNVGSGPLHNANHAGLTSFGSGQWPTPEMLPPEDYAGHEIIQLDGALGAAHAVLEMLVQERGNPPRQFIHIAPRLPRFWGQAQVAGVAMPGGFLLDVEWRDGHPLSIWVHSRMGGTLRIQPNLGPAWLLDGRPINTLQWEGPTQANQKLHFQSGTQPSDDFAPALPLPDS